MKKFPGTDFVKTIAVDFDGVIHKYSRGWQDGSIYDDPMPGSYEGLLSLMENYAVFIHTTRDPASVAGWIAARFGIDCFIEEDLDTHEISLGKNNSFWTEKDKLLVTNRKLVAIAYIDDRALKFDNWFTTMEEVAKLY